MDAFQKDTSICIRLTLSTTHDTCDLVTDQHLTISDLQQMQTAICTLYRIHHIKPQVIIFHPCSPRGEKGIMTPWTTRSRLCTGCLAKCSPHWASLNIHIKVGEVTGVYTAGLKTTAGDVNSTYCSIDMRQSKEMKKREPTSLKPFPGTTKVVTGWSEPTKTRPGSPLSQP